MSKPIDPKQPPVQRSAVEQLQVFAAQYRPLVIPESYDRLTARTRELQLDLTPDELVILAALDTPGKVQQFLNTQVYYNNDHAHPDQEETAMPPRAVLATAHAHCFEGALFAYTVNYLHGHAPRWVLLEASQDPDHNLVVFQDPHTGLYGSNAHSTWPHLDGRPAEFPTLWSLVETYVPWYISDLTNDPRDLTLVGYSEPFDLVLRFGAAWMGSQEPLWDIYYTYVDDSVTFHYLYEESGETHLYPLMRAFKEGWIRVDAQGKGQVDADALPQEARALWARFWRTFEPPVRPPRGEPREVQEAFRRMTGTTPIDLTDYADDLQYFTSGGFDVREFYRRSRL